MDYTKMEQTCKTCGFYENNCPFIRGKLIPYPNKVCKDYTYSVVKAEQEPEVTNDLLEYEPTRAVRLPDGRLITEKLARQIDINLLNKAAEELALRAFPEKKSYSSVYDRVVDYNAVDRKNYRDGILAGAELMKKQMMEEAVEGEAEELYNDGEIHCTVGVGTYFKPGDKVYVLKAEEGEK